MPRIYSYTTDGIDNLRTLTQATHVGNFNVPTGFTWDGASVPKAAQLIMPRWGENSGAFLLHDFLYSTRGPADITRNFADRILYSDLRNSGVGRVRAWLVFKTVDVFGARFFRKSRAGSA